MLIVAYNWDNVILIFTTLLILQTSAHATTILSLLTTQSVILSQNISQPKTKLLIQIELWKIYERKHKRIKNTKKKYICIIIGWDYALLHALNIMDKKNGTMDCIISIQDALELWPVMQNKLLLQLDTFFTNLLCLLLCEYNIKFGTQ